MSECQVEMTLRRLLRDFGMNWAFHSVQGWSMERTFQLYLQLSVLLITITEKVGTRSSCKEWLTMSVDSLRCTLGGLEECMMQEYLSICLCTRVVRMVHSSLTAHLWKRNSIAGVGRSRVPSPLMAHKAFPDNSSLSCQQETFNYRLSRARVVVEHAYGRLKERWCLLNISTWLFPKLVAACCVLHNICEIHQEIFNEEWLVSPTIHLWVVKAHQLQ